MVWTEVPTGEGVTALMAQLFIAGLGIADRVIAKVGVRAPAERALRDPRPGPTKYCCDRPGGSRVLD